MVIIFFAVKTLIVIRSCPCVKLLSLSNPDDFCDRLRRQEKEVR